MTEDVREDRQPVLVLKPQGSLNLEACADLRHQLASAFAAGIQEIGVDLSGVTMIDQPALDLLAGAARHLRKQGGDLIVGYVPERIATTLRINGLGALLDEAMPPLASTG